MGYQLPEGFVWGTATSGHQVDGADYNSDWWWMEHQSDAPTAAPSGDACDHWHRYVEDIVLLGELGLNAYRFSLDWQRIEPEDGEFSRAALDHYLRMCAICRENGLEPIVTFHHFTLPRWVHDEGGWLWDQTPDRLAKYCERTANHLAGELCRCVTINEPDLMTNLGYRFAQFPAGWVAGGGEEVARRAAVNLSKAHPKARAAIAAEAPGAKIGCSLAVQAFDVSPGGEPYVDAYRSLWEGPFFEVAKDGDFVGVQSYGKFRVGPTPLPDLTKGSPKFFEVMMGMSDWPADIPRTPMGPRLPGSVADSVRRAHEQTGLPVLITENGIATDDDDDRIDYLQHALGSLEGVLYDGVPLEGYIYWSFMDSFEWGRGYGLNFGLVGCDRETLKRTVKPSAKFLGDIARNNELP